MTLLSLRYAINDINDGAMQWPSHTGEIFDLHLGAGPCIQAAN